MRTILIFTIILLILIVLFLSWDGFGARGAFVSLRGKNPTPVRRLFLILYMLALILMTGVSIKQLNDYVYPSNPEIFSNVDYHTLRHNGFLVPKRTALVDSEHPTQALWDGESQTGTILLENGKILLKNYDLPFYTYHHKGKSKWWTLENPTHEIDISRGLTIKKDNQPFYQLEICQKDQSFMELIKGTTPDYYYISHYIPNGSSGVRADTSDFDSKIHQGYPLMDIIRRTPNISEKDYHTLDSVLSGSYVLRNIIYTERRDKKKQSTLTIFAGTQLQNNDNYKILNTTPLDRVFEINYTDSITFYTGIGETKSDEMVLKIDTSQRNQLQVCYRLPKRKHLPKYIKKDSIEFLFIVSQPDSVVEQASDKGYLYDIFNEARNQHHIHGSISYIPNTARDSLVFGVTDGIANVAKTVHGNESFELKMHNDCGSWLMSMEDLRASNPLQPQNIYTFLLLFLFIIVLRICVDEFIGLHAVSITELAIYLIMLAYGVIRCILMWRITTFPPIEGVTLNVWNTMRGNELKFMQLVYISVPLVAMGWSCYPLMPQWMHKLKSFIKKCSLVQQCKESKAWKQIDKLVIQSKSLIQSYKESKRGKWIKDLTIKLTSFVSWCQQVKVWVLRLMNKYYGIIIVYALLLLGCFVLRFTPIGQMANICLPIILYFLTDWWAVYKQHSQLLWQRIIFVIELLAYLFIIDKGIILVFGFFLIIYHIMFRLTQYKNRPNSRIRINTGVCCFLLALVLTGIMRYEGSIIRSLPLKSTHIYWRAEMQHLPEEKTIGDLIAENEYNSDAVMYIMRSALNQWFINQYINLGKEVPFGNFMKLQPHSNQGSPYPTQTTDLVMVRYVLAEHNGLMVFSMMLIYLLLIVIYGLEAGLRNKNNFAAFAGLVYLYTVALNVYLAATNRIVFIGQDFPLVSTQSKTAVIFPILIFLIAIIRLIYIRRSPDGHFADQRGELDLPNKFLRENYKSVLVPWVFLALFSVLTWWTISPKGKGQNEQSFNVPGLLESTSQIIDRLDDDFVKYQQENPIHASLRVDHFEKVWEAFTKDNTYNQQYLKLVAKPDFVGSLLKHFTEQQRVKTNPDELLYLQRTNQLHLRINKSYYTITSVNHKGAGWRGNLLAATAKNQQTMNARQNGYSCKKIPNTANTYEATYVPGWHRDGRHLRLVQTLQASGKDAEKFTIETATGEDTIKSFRHNIVATAVPTYGIVKVERNGKKLYQDVNDKKNVSSDEKFLAKNLWINGRRQHFYPLHANRMWDYNFANMLSQTIENMNEKQQEKYEETDLQLTIDYELIQQLEKEAHNFKYGEFNDFIAVVIDGDGKIRSLFNYAPKAQVGNPNDILDLEKKRIHAAISGSKTATRELMGSSALLPIKSGPGSTFKPIVYTAVTARVPIDWESIDLALEQNKTLQNNPLAELCCKVNETDDELSYSYYGGIKLPIPFSIKGAMGPGQKHTDYIEESNNLYHSMVTLMGMANNYNFNQEKFDAIVRPDSIGRMAKRFPIFYYKNQLMNFDPNGWYVDPGNFVSEYSALSESLNKNFHIMMNIIDDSEFPYDTTFFGKTDTLSWTYKSRSSGRRWSSAELGTMNLADRRIDPLKRGFNQMFLGAAPLHLTPLQMGVNVLRLATLNRTQNITTIVESEDLSNDYEFFDIEDGWGGDEEYFKFYQRQVLTQMNKVALTGTGKSLRHYAKKLEKAGYYLYCKTGTLGDRNTDDEEKKTKKMKKTKKREIKHLMVIIANQPIHNSEKVPDIEAFRQAKKYVCYFSFYGVEENKLKTSWYQPYIESVVNSNLFKTYMNQ